MSVTQSEIDQLREWGGTPRAVAQFFIGREAVLRDRLSHLRQGHAIRPDENLNLNSSGAVNEALNDLMHLKERAAMGDYQFARDELMKQLAAAVLEKSRPQGELQAQVGSLPGDDLYSNWKIEQQGVGTELQRAKSSGLEQQFPNLVSAAATRLDEVKDLLINTTQRGKLEDQQRQAVKKEAELRALLQSLPK